MYNGYMTKNISVPDIGDFKDVEIIEILVKTGDKIKKDDPIVTLESDKSSVEVPSPFEGKISELKVKIGDKVSKGAILAVIKQEKQSVEPKEKEAPKTEKIKVLPETEKIIKEAESTISEKSKDESKQKIITSLKNGADIDPIETKEWLDSLNAVIANDGSERADYLVKKLIDEAYKEGSHKPLTRITPYINTTRSKLVIWDSTRSGWTSADTVVMPWNKLQ